jgi:hypothetical protein
MTTLSFIDQYENSNRVKFPFVLRMAIQRFLSNFLWHRQRNWRMVFIMPNAPVVPTRVPTPPSLSGRWFLAILGLSIALLGCLFVWLMTRSFLRAREMRTWPEVLCVIITSELEQRRHDENSPMEYRQNLSFGYEWNGKAYTSQNLTLRGSPWSSKRALAEQRIIQFPRGKQTTCRVNPNAVEFAVLNVDSLAPGYSIWFPCLFVIGGLGITYRATFVKKVLV